MRNADLINGLNTGLRMDRFLVISVIVMIVIWTIGMVGVMGLTTENQNVFWTLGLGSWIKRQSQKMFNSHQLFFGQWPSDSGKAHFVGAEIPWNQQVSFSIIRSFIACLVGIPSKSCCLSSSGSCSQCGSTQSTELCLALAVTQIGFVSPQSATSVLATEKQPTPVEKWFSQFFVPNFCFLRI